MDQLGANDKANTQLTDSGSSEPVSKDNSVTNAKSEGGETKHKTFRSALRANLSEKAETKTEPRVEVVKAEPAKAAVADLINDSILPPADMNAEEKAAFLNPTAQNTGILQKYLSRRSYELQSDHTRKTGELYQKSREVEDISKVVGPEREYYAKKKIPVETVVANAIAWDKAMENDRLTAAREWLESYGVDPSELIAGQGQQQAANPQYLTREQAEQLAEEKAAERIQHEFSMREQSRIAEEQANVVQQFIAADPLFRDPGTGAQLEEAMAPVVAGLRAANPRTPVKEILETARKYVVSGNPVFSELASKLAAKQDIGRQNAEAEKAIAASRSISGGPGSGTPKIKAKNFREGVRARLNGAA